MYFDRLDIVEAWYLALRDCHGGQWSREYYRLSKMYRYFQPSPMLEPYSLTENGKAIYRAACERLLKQ